METHQINSSHIISIEFHPNELHLIVYFKGGSVYRYMPFYESQLNNFLSSESKGKWFVDNVKNNKSIRFLKLK